MLTRLDKVNKKVIRSGRTKWMAPNKCHGTFFVHWSSQVSAV